MRNLSLILSIVLFFTLVSNGFSQNEGVTKTKPAKDPGKAFLYSFIPGAGQMHNDQVYLGLGIFAVDLGLFALAVGMDDDGGYTDGSVGIVYGLAGALYFAQLIHAPLTSQKINKENGYLGEKRSRPNLWLGVGCTNESMIKLGYTF